MSVFPRRNWRRHLSRGSDERECLWCGSELGVKLPNGFHLDCLERFLSILDKKEVHIE